MLKSILVGLDGSPHSQMAVELGIRLAKKSDALLVGLGIIDEPGITGAEPIPLGATYFKEQRDKQLLANARHRVEQFLEQFSLRCTGEQVASKVLEDVGQPWEQICLEAQRFDMVLLGRRTFFHVDTGDGIDPTLKEVVKHSTRPVMTVPNSLRPGKCVVVAYDGSQQAGRAVQAFWPLGLDEGQEVLVLSVDRDFTAAARHADRAAEFLRFHDLKARAYPVASPSGFAETLLERVWELDPSLLVMGAYGQPAWREFFFGSVTKAILKESPVPLFLYH